MVQRVPHAAPPVGIALSVAVKSQPGPRPSPLVPSIPSCCYEVLFQGAVCLSRGLGGVSTRLPAGPWPVPSVLLGPAGPWLAWTSALALQVQSSSSPSICPGAGGAQGCVQPSEGLPLSPAAASPCPSLCRWAQACTLGTATHAAHGACPLPWGQHGPCVRLVIRSPCLPTCSLSAPRSPAQQSLCPGLRAPKVDWHPCPSLSKTREGRRGPGRLVGGETGRKRRVKSSGEAAAQQVRPLPAQQVCLSPCLLRPQHTHPERPQHLRGVSRCRVGGGRGRAPLLRVLGLGLTRMVCEYLGTLGCHEVTHLLLAALPLRGRSLYPGRCPDCQPPASKMGPPQGHWSHPGGRGHPHRFCPQSFFARSQLCVTSRQGPVSGEGAGRVCLQSAGRGTSGYDPSP